MRISATDFRFYDRRTPGHAPAELGWFVSATDASLDNQSWLVHDHKITPAQALAIAAAFDAVLTENTGRPVDVFTRGIQAQNEHAQAVADAAAKSEAASAEQARLRAEALAEWDTLNPEPTPVSE